MDSMIPTGAVRGATIALAAALAVATLLFWAGQRIRRSRIERRLRERAAFESLESKTTEALKRSELRHFEDVIWTTLVRLAEITRSAHISLHLMEPEGIMEVRKSYVHPPNPALSNPTAFSTGFPYAYSMILASKEVRSTGYPIFPAGAVADVASAKRIGIRSGFVLPLHVHGQLRGGIAIGWSVPNGWRPEWVDPVRRLGEGIVTIQFEREAAEGKQGAASGRAVIPSSVESFVVTLDRNARVTYTNQHQEMAGVTIGAEYPPETGELEEYHRTNLREAVRSVVNGEVPYAGMLIRLPTERWLLVQIEAMPRPEGGVVLTHTDITYRRQTELTGARALRELEHWNRISAMAELASSLAHEISQPLSAIVANGAAASRLSESAVPDWRAIREILQEITQDGKRAGDVIRNMRAMLKKNLPLSGRVSLNELAAATRALVENQASLRGVRIQTDMVADPLFVTLDPIQLQQVILNLLTNAIEAAGSQQSEPREVKLRTQIEANTALLEVADTGPGIPPAHREKVFEPFYSTKATGLGVGLSISRSIIDQAGGRIWAEGSPGRGTVMRVRLPRAPG